MATRAELYQALRNADAAGDVEGARKLAAYIKTMPAETGVKAADQLDADRKLYDPTAGQSFGQNMLQGVGSGMTSVIRALGGGKLAGAMGLPATKEEAQQIDAPLMNTAGGKVGQAVGVAAPAALAIPFTPATIGGATAAGAITGGALTEGGLGDRATGAALGGAGGAIAGALPAVYQAGKGAVRGIVEPMTNAGRERIAGRAIERFSTNPSALERLTNAPTQTGARLTLAEATQDPGLMTLQRAISTMDPEAAAMFGARQEANNAARLSSLETLTGGGPAAAAARSAAAKESYGKAFAQGIDQKAADALEPEIKALMSRPSIKAGMAKARALAAEDGVDLGADGSVQGLHYLKQSLDDQIKRLVDQPTKQRLVTKTAAELADVLEQISPAYQAARKEYAANSIPVNRAEVGARLVDKTTSAMRDMSGNRKLQANAFARALNDEEQLLRQSGVRGQTQLNQLLTPDQFGNVQAVRSELETLANLNNAANGPGSQTAKMLASQNLLRQIAGPLGLPDSWVESVLAQSLLRPVQFAAKAGEARIGQNVADAMLDPAIAARLMGNARAYDQVTPPNALQMLLRRSAPALIGANAAQ